jgi:hypothetical protein
MAKEVGQELGSRPLLLGEVSTRRELLVTTVTLVTSVFMSKADALAVLEDVLDAPWNIDDPGDVTLPLAHGAVLSIEVPHYGEDLPLTLDLHHDDESVLREVADQVSGTLEKVLGWSIHEIPRGADG